MLDLERINPFVRRVQMKRDKTLSGQWQDFDHVLTFLDSGSAEFIIDGTQYLMSEGDAVLMPPYARHIIISSGGERPLVQYNIHFDLFSDPYQMTFPYRDVWNERGPKEPLACERMLEGKPVMLSFSKEEQELVRRLFLMLYAEYSRRGTYSTEMERGLLLCILVQVARKINNQGEIPAKRQMLGSKAWSNISCAIDFIGSNYSNPNLSNEDISAAVGVSSIYLTTEFKRCFDISLHRYLVNLRLERAADLLQHGIHSITEIAEMTGFSSIQSFSKAFRRNTGISPREYANTRVSKSYDFFRQSREAK